MYVVKVPIEIIHIANPITAIFSQIEETEDFS